MIFSGEFDHRIDSQGRVAIPVRFRDAYKPGMVLAEGYERCLDIYTLYGWGRVANEITPRPSTNANRSPARARFPAASAPAATRATFDKPEDHLFLPEIISKEPLGAVVRHGDDQWADIVRWTIYAPIAAEESGVTAANVDQKAMDKSNPNVSRMLGSEGNLGGMLGLDKAWAKRAIKAQGNYAEIFERNVGLKTPVGLARGLNALYTNGGLQYSPPFR